jgi:hypothetical protein
MSGMKIEEEPVKMSRRQDARCKMMPMMTEETKKGRKRRKRKEKNETRSTYRPSHVSAFVTQARLSNFKLDDDHLLLVP